MQPKNKFNNCCKVLFSYHIWLSSMEMLVALRNGLYYFKPLV